MTSNTPETQALLPVEVTQADFELAEKVVDAANIVSHDGYYEADISRVAETLARHRQSSSNAGGVDAFEAERDDNTFTIRFPSGYAITARADGRIIVTKAEAGFVPFETNVASLSTPTAEPMAELQRLGQEYDEDALDRLAVEVLHNYRKRDGLTCYNYDHNRQRDERYMRETFAELVAPFIAALTTPPTPDRIGKDAVREALAFIDKFFEPWGAWKTAWWEGDVSDDAAFSADNALKHVANILRRATPAQEGAIPLCIRSRPLGPLPNDAPAQPVDETERLREAEHLLSAIENTSSLGAAILKVRRRVAALQHKGEVSRG